MLSFAGVQLVIDHTKATKRKRTLHKGPPAAKKTKAGEVSSAPAPPPSIEESSVMPSEQTPEVGSFVELMSESLADLHPLSSRDVGLQRIEGFQDEEVHFDSPGGVSPARKAYKQVVSEDEDLQEISPNQAQQQTNFGGASSSATPRTHGDGSRFFIPGVTLPPLGEGMLQNARNVGVDHVADEYSYHISRVRVPILL